MIGLSILLRYVQPEGISIEQLQPLPEIGKPHSPPHGLFFRWASVDTVHAVEMECLFFYLQPYLHKGGVLVTYAVLEGILDDADEQQGRQDHSLPITLR